MRWREGSISMDLGTPGWRSQSPCRRRHTLPMSPTGGREVEDGMEGGVHLDGFGDTQVEVTAALPPSSYPANVAHRGEGG
jgi:hypothetical protein